MSAFSVCQVAWCAVNQANYVLTSANLTRSAHSGNLPWAAPDLQPPLATIGIDVVEFGHWAALVWAPVTWLVCFHKSMFHELQAAKQSRDGPDAGALDISDVSQKEQ